jgi:hypothetical protein
MRVAISGKDPNEIKLHKRKNRHNTCVTVTTPKAILAKPNPEKKKKTKKKKKLLSIPTSLDSGSSSSPGWIVVCDMINFVFEEHQYKLINSSNGELKLTLEQARILFDDNEIKIMNLWIDNDGNKYILIKDEQLKLTLEQARILFNDNDIKIKNPWIDKEGNKYILI